MAEYPAHGLGNWDDELKAYIDAGGLSEQAYQAALQAAEDAQTAAITAEGVADDIESLLLQQATSPDLIQDPNNPGYYLPSVPSPGYDVFLLAGQSNMSGRGVIDALIDVRDPLSFQYASDGAEANRKNRITTADEPLGHPDRLVLGNGLGPGGPFANWYATTLPSGRKILLVPAAFGGTGFSTSMPNNWTTASGSLYQRAIAQMNAAITAGGAGSKAAGILWVQGEADAEGDPNATPARAPMTPAAYQTAFDALITGFRAGITGGTNLPFIIGRMAPGFIARGTNHAAIDAVQVATPNRLGGIFVAAGPSGQDDGTHYNAVGIRGLGRNMFAAFKVPPAIPVPVSDNFDRADSSTSMGSALTPGSGVWGIRSNKAYLVSSTRAGAAPYDIAVITSASPNGTVSVDLTGTQVDIGAVGLTWRAADSNNYWALRLGGNVVQVYKTVGGQTGAVGSYAFAHASSGTYTLSVTLVGDSHVIKANGATITTITDSALQTATGFGLWAIAVNANSSFDNFAYTP